MLLAFRDIAIFNVQQICSDVYWNCLNVTLHCHDLFTNKTKSIKPICARSKMQTSKMLSNIEVIIVIIISLFMYIPSPFCISLQSSIGYFSTDMIFNIHANNLVECLPITLGNLNPLFS